MKSLILFAGGGGTALGLQRAGFQIETACEKVFKVKKCYEKNIGKVHESEWEDFKASYTDYCTSNYDLIEVSPPSARINANTALTIDAVQFALSLTPKSILIEVNPALANARKGKDLLRIKQAVEGLYNVHPILLNASSYGVPQDRNSLFLVCIDKYINKQFKVQQGGLKRVFKDISDGKGRPISAMQYKYWKERQPSEVSLGDTMRRFGRKSNFSSKYVSLDKLVPRISKASNRQFLRVDDARRLSNMELTKAMGFPVSYDYLGYNEVTEIIGNSCCPVVAHALGVGIKNII